MGGMVAQYLGHGAGGTSNLEFEIQSVAILLSCSNPRQVICTHTPLFTKQYKLMRLRVTFWIWEGSLAENNGNQLLGLWLMSRVAGLPRKPEVSTGPYSPLRLWWMCDTCMLSMSYHCILLSECILLFECWLCINSMLQSCKTADEAAKLSAEGQAVLQLIENSPKPIVSAIMGSCLGGGLEVCTYCILNLIRTYLSWCKPFNFV